MQGVGGFRLTTPTFRVILANVHKLHIKGMLRGWCERGYKAETYMIARNDGVRGYETSSPVKDRGISSAMGF